MGERGNATVIAVPTCSRSLAWPATTHASSGSWAVSPTNQPS
jgi:hypothetical protein